jgi:hypothetical protein
LYIVLAIIAFPVVALTFMPLLVNIFIVTKLVDSIDNNFNNRSRYSQSDIAFGGNEERAKKTFQRLRSITADTTDGRITAATLSVAIISVTENRTITEPTLFGWGKPTVRPQPIHVDLEHVGTGAVLLIANRPILWSPTNVKPDYRAKIAVEGAAVFDIENAPYGLLAGFRIAAFGADGATEPHDVAPTANSAQTARFCASMRLWIKHFRVHPDNIRVWRLTDPTQIAVQGNNLTAIGGSYGRSEHITEYCR